MQATSFRRKVETNCKRAKVDEQADLCIYRERGREMVILATDKVASLLRKMTASTTFYLYGS